MKKRYKLTTQPTMRCSARVLRKVPVYTSQFCHHYRRWDRRSRAGDRFCCVYCGFSTHADLNTAQNLVLLGEVGVYSLRSLPSLGCVPIDTGLSNHVSNLPPGLCCRYWG